MNRRGFIRSVIRAAAVGVVAATVDPEQLEQLLWTPGAKKIFIPKPMLTTSKALIWTTRMDIESYREMYPSSEDYFKKYFQGDWNPEQQHVFAGRRAGKTSSIKTYTEAMLRLEEEGKPARFPGAAYQVLMNKNDELYIHLIEPYEPVGREIDSIWIDEENKESK